MIKINKSKTPPEKLLTDGKKKRRVHSASYTRNKTKYDDGDKTLFFEVSLRTFRKI